MDQQEFYEQLVHRYVTGKATEKELEAFFALLESGEIRETLEAYMRREESAILEKEPMMPVKRLRKAVWRYAAAAAILIFATAGGYWYLHQKATLQTAQNQSQDIKPGGNKMFLTTANGKRINLSDAKRGMLTQQGAAAITKTADGQIVYTIGEKTASETGTNRMNTLETPMSGQGSAVLSDGTKVWLNAGSKLTYPAVFSGKERKVELQGEAYIEVAHNAKMPFKVITSSQTVEDIGTRFDINAYSDEPQTRTTLAEGSVRVSANNQSALLTPGQQARITPGNTKISIIQVNTGIITAWKDGYFRFEDEPLPAVMRQFARWYDIEIVYNNSTYADQTFNVKVPRNANLQAVLKIISQSGIRFKIEGRKLIVL